MQRRLIFSAIILTVAFLSGLYFAAGTRNGTSVPDVPGLLWPDPPQIAPFSLLATDGTPFTEQNLVGRWTLIFFGFTNCPDICPTTMNTLNQTYEKLRGNDELLETIQVVFVSVDPERDDNEVLRDYVHYFNEDFVGATADDDNLSQLTRQFGIFFMKVETAGVPGYAMNHSGSILLVDPKTRFVGVFSQPHVADEIAQGLTRIVSFLAPLE